MLLASGKAKEAIPSDAVVQLPTFDSTLLNDISPGSYELVLTLKQGDKVLSENSYPVSVVE